jgi:hypothetical protein
VLLGRVRPARERRRRVARREGRRRTWRLERRLVEQWIVQRGLLERRVQQQLGVRVLELRRGIVGRLVLVVVRLRLRLRLVVGLVVRLFLGLLVRFLVLGLRVGLGLVERGRRHLRRPEHPRDLHGMRDAGPAVPAERLLRRLLLRHRHRQVLRVSFVQLRGPSRHGRPPRG